MRFGARSQVLRHIIKVAELDSTHPLHGCDAQDAKTKFEGQLRLYAPGYHPSHRPLGKQESPLAYWRSLKNTSDSFIISIVTEKLFSVLPNSMCDERTGSRISFLDSDLRSRTDIKAMTEQIKITQLYNMIEGRPKLKPRTAAHFRDLPESAKLPLPGPEVKATYHELIERPDSWLDEEPSELDPDLCAGYDMEQLTGQLNALRIINMQSPALADILSAWPVDLPIPQASILAESSTQCKGKQKKRVRSADEVAWDE
ncbi:hypothetical protein RhiJN_23665 [Ceratobasidium sp. AG-Ba]|nr:hypothetical protein RhiJN_23665 [Ceratobasidium sp. AG-Ba]